MARLSTAGYHRVMAGIGAPVNGSTMRACVIWQRAEGGSAKNNPWNTTQPAPGATNYNSVGVKNYPDEATGIKATVETLLNGYYTQLLHAFRKGTSGLEICAAVDASPWGTHHAAQLYRDIYVG